MKNSSISKIAIAVGVNALVFGGLVAGPASADPTSGVLYGDLVGTGSDTTQDILNGLSMSLGTNSDTGNRYITSYDAAPGIGAGSSSAHCNSADDKITPVLGGGTFVRPNGSSNGRDTLRAAIGQASSASVKSFACGLLGAGGAAVSLATTDIKGLVHFARSSSGPPASDTNASGVVAYVPFARDAMTVAVSPTSKMPALTFGTASVNTEVGGVVGKVESTLYALYNCKATQIVTPATGSSFLANANYVPVDGDVASAINTYIPQLGSGTRAYWIARFNITEANITAGAANAACLDDTIDGSVGTGEFVQEHSGRAVGADDYGVTPHSIPTFVAQNNGVEGVVSRIEGAVLHPIGGIAATTGTGTSKVMNPTYLTSPKTTMLTRLMFNVVPSRVLDDPNSLEREVFFGTTSRVCQATSTITAYGYGLLTASTGSSSCGFGGLRAYVASAASFTIDVVDAESPTANVVTSAVEGDTVVFRVKLLTSNGNGGGTVQLSDGNGNVFETITLPAAAITATNTTWVYKSVTLDTDLPAGAYSVDATFVPTLPGVETKLTQGLIAFALEQRDVDGFELLTYPNTYKVKKAGKLDVTVEATGVVPTGIVKIFQGSKLLGTSTLDDTGFASVTLKKFKKKGSMTLRVTYEGDNTFLPSETTQAITVTK